MIFFNKKINLKNRNFAYENCIYLKLKKNGFDY